MILKLSHFQYVEGNGGISLPNSIGDKRELCSKFKIHISTKHPYFLTIYWVFWGKVYCTAPVRCWMVTESSDTPSSMASTCPGWSSVPSMAAGARLLDRLSKNIGHKITSCRRALNIESCCDAGTTPLRTSSTLTLSNLMDTKSHIWVVFKMQRRFLLVLSNIGCNSVYLILNLIQHKSKF